MRFGVNGTRTRLREPNTTLSHVVIPNLDLRAGLVELSSTEMSQNGKHRDTDLAIPKTPCVACHAPCHTGRGKARHGEVHEGEMQRACSAT
jgi:hypothetical protein